MNAVLTFAAVPTPHPYPHTLTHSHSHLSYSFEPSHLGPRHNGNTSPLPQAGHHDCNSVDVHRKLRRHRPHPARFRVHLGGEEGAQGRSQRPSSQDVQWLLPAGHSARARRTGAAERGAVVSQHERGEPDMGVQWEMDAIARVEEPRCTFSSFPYHPAHKATQGHHHEQGG